MHTTFIGHTNYKKIMLQCIDPELHNKLDQKYSGVEALDHHAWTPSVIGANIIDDIDVDQQSHDFIDDFLHHSVDQSDESILTLSMRQAQNLRKRKKGKSHFLKDGITYLLSSDSIIIATIKNQT